MPSSSGSFPLDSHPQMEFTMEKPTIRQPKLASAAGDRWVPSASRRRPEEDRSSREPLGCERVVSLNHKEIAGIRGRGQSRQKCQHYKRESLRNVSDSRRLRHRVRGPGQSVSGSENVLKGTPLVLQFKWVGRACENYFSTSFFFKKRRKGGGERDCLVQLGVPAAVPVLQRGEALLLAPLSHLATSGRDEGVAAA